MAQHDYDIANDTAANVRADINDVLSAIVSNNSGSSEPSTTYANQWWYDTANNILKIRDETDTTWIDFATLDQLNGVWKFPTDATPDTDSTYDLGESTLKWANLYVDNISDGTDTVGTEYVVNGSSKAWAEGTSTGLGNTFNCSSFTDNGTGFYTVTWTNSMSNFPYPAPISHRGSGARLGVSDQSNANEIDLRLYRTNDTLDDVSWQFSLHGDLA